MSRVRRKGDEVLEPMRRIAPKLLATSEGHRTDGNPVCNILRALFSTKKELEIHGLAKTLVSQKDLGRLCTREDLKDVLRDELKFGFPEKHIRVIIDRAGEPEAKLIDNLCAATAELIQNNDRRDGELDEVLSRNAACCVQALIPSLSEYGMLVVCNALIEAYNSYTRGNIRPLLEQIEPRVDGTVREQIVKLIG